jgi:hypothetical protein
MRNNPIRKKIIIGQPIALERDDLEKLLEGNRPATSIQKLRSSHHRIARLTAFGLTAKEIAGYVGMTSQRVLALQTAPAMVELISKYQARNEERELEQGDAYFEYRMRNAVAMERHIAEQIEEADEKGEYIPIRTALAYSSDTADRFGYGKRNTTTNVNLDASVLERMISRYNKAIDSAPAHTSQARPLPMPSSRTNPTHGFKEPEQLFNRRVV